MSIATSPRIFFLMGPTASGKTELVIRLRQILPVEIISVDSALIYQGMDIGTAKPTVQELSKAPHYLLDIIDPSQSYSVADFCRDALIEITKILEADRVPILVGGSMLYFKTLLEGLSQLPPSKPEIREEIAKQVATKGCKMLHQQLMTIDPVSAKRIHVNDFQRLSRALEVFLVSGKTLTELTKTRKKILNCQVYQFAISTKNRDLLYQRIKDRFYRMLALGFEEEVHRLFFRKDLHKDMPSIRCVGYRQMWSWFAGEIPYDEMIYQSICTSQRLAKRQISWLRNWKWKIHWLNSEDLSKSLDEILRVMKNNIQD